VALLAVQLDADQPLRVGQVDPMFPALAAHPVLRDGLGEPGVVEQHHEQAGEIGFRYPLAISAIEDLAGAYDPGPAPAGVQQQRSPQVDPTRKAQPTDLVDRSQQLGLVADHSPPGR
jgi:hypothetical protein